MDLDGLRPTVVGFAGALLVLAALFFVIGLDDVAMALAPASPAVVGLVVVAALSWLAAWGLALRTVLGALGIALPVRTALLLFAAAQFANNVTPFGQAGGEPVSAMFISRAADREYETGLAAIASVDALNFVPSIAFAVIGLGYYALAFTLGPRLRQAAAVVLGLVVVVPVLGYGVWHYRRRFESGVAATLTPLLRLLGRAVPRLAAPGPSAVRARIRGFFRDLGRVGTDRRQLLVALSFSALGWIALAAALWLSLFALGHAVPVAAVLVAVPLGAVAGVTPLPGGLGGIEAVLVVLLVATAGVSPAVAAAAVLVHRLATYWLPVILGGGAAAALGAAAHGS